MQITSTTLRRIIKEELGAAMEEGVLDDIVGRKPSGAPMTAQARQDILDGYMRAIADMQNVIPGLSREEAVENLIDLATAGGDPYVDPQSEMFDEDLVRSLLSGEVAMNENEDAEDAAEDAAYDNLESCVRTVIKDLLAAGVGADEASNIVFSAVRSTVSRAL